MPDGQVQVPLAVSQMKTCPIMQCDTKRHRRVIAAIARDLFGQDVRQERLAAGDGHMITHKFREVDACVDEVSVLRRGKLVNCRRMSGVSRYTSLRSLIILNIYLLRTRTWAFGFSTPLP